MTVEVGAVTGKSDVVVHLNKETLEILVRYAGAEEWYTVEGSPVVLENAAGLSSSELYELHERVVRHLTMAGAIVNGNEEPTPLREFSLRNCLINSWRASRLWVLVVPDGKIELLGPDLRPREASI